MRYIPIAVATFIWIWPTIFIKALSPHFDNCTQNFYRFLAGSVVLVLMSLTSRRAEFVSAFKNIKMFIPLALIAFSFQISWVGGIFLLTPAIAALISKSSILFIMLFSYILFQDERKVIKSRMFIFGTFLAISGVVGVIVGGEGVNPAGKFGAELSNGGGFNFGVVLVLIGSFFWALYIIAIKYKLRTTDSFVLASVVFTLTVPLFFIAALFFGDLRAIGRAPPGMTVLLFLSGAFCVGIAHAFNNRSIKLIGATVSSNFVLVTPFFTGIFSHLILGEVITLCQILSGVVLIAGCAMLISVKGNP